MYLDTESKNLLAQGKKDDALKLLKNGKTLVEDTDAVDNLIAEAEEGVTGGDYILPESNSRYLTDADVSGLTLQQLIMRKMKSMQDMEENLILRNSRIILEANHGITERLMRLTLRKQYLMNMKRKMQNF